MRAVRGFPHIYKRGDRYVYRREVPKKVRPRIQTTRNGKLRREWVHSLKTTRLDVAERKAAALAAEHDRIIDHVRSGQEAIEADAREIMAMGQAEVYDHLRFASEMFGDRDTWPDHLKAMVEILENGGPRQPMPVSVIYKADKVRVAEAGRTRSEKPIEEAVNDFLTVIGDKDIQSITYREVEDWISAMRRGVTRKKKNDKRPMAPATIRRRVEARVAVGSGMRLGV